MGFPWYEEVSHGEPLTQGDIILDFPVPIIGYGEDYPFFQASGAEFDVIVMTQACDLEHGKVEEMSFCAIESLDEIIKAMMSKEIGPEINFDKLTERQRKMPRNFVEQLKRGQHTNYHLLNEVDTKKDSTMKIDMKGQVVLLKKTYQLPIKSVGAIMMKKYGNRLRLLPPYREHLAQAYANTYSRIGLPMDVDHRNIRLEIE